MHKKTSQIPRVSILAMFIVGLLWARASAADTLTVQWDFNSEAEVEGYVLHIGTQAGIYTQTVDVGNNNTYTLANVVAGQRYCFAAQAYAGSAFSEFSLELCGYSNAYPVLTPVPGSRTDDVGQSVTLQLQGSDPLGDPITYSATALPAGLALTQSSGLITGVLTTAGTYTVAVTVSDGVLSAGQTFTWTVRPANQPPVLANPGTQTSDVGQATTLQLQATDSQGQTLTYSATGVPAGLTLSASTGRIAGTPTTAGPFTVTATVSDGALSASQTFTWTVRPANQPPVLTNPGSQSGDVGQATALQLQATDAQGQTLTYSATGVPAGLTLTASTGRIAGTPTTAGPFTVTATVSDGALSASQTFTWTVRPANQPPVLTNPGTQTSDVGQATALQLQASDAQGQTLTYSVTGVPAGLTLTASTGRVAGTPATAGTFTVTTTVSDGALSASQTFTWTVRPANQPPVLTNPGAQTGDVGQATSLQLQASDAQGQTLTYSATGLPAGLTLTASTGRIAGTPTTVGTLTVMATVSDGALSASQTFAWTVRPANQPPVLTNPGAQTGDVGQATALQLQASDAQGQTLTYSATGVPAGLTLIASTGRIAGTPATAGTLTVTATVSDGALSSSQTFTWTVRPANQPPVLTNPVAQTGDVGQPTALQLQASDAQGQTLTYSATGVPAGLTLTASTGRIAGTPTTAGTLTVTATVSDGSLSASQVFTWTIRPANQPPVLTNPGAQTSDVGVATALQLQATDAQGQTLTYGATGLPTGLTLTASTGLIVGTPTTAGTVTVTATVSDGALSASQTFTWTVRPANQPPVLTNPGAQTSDAGVATALQLQATDAQGQTLVYSATGVPAGLTLTASTGRIAGTPTTASTFTVTATASDGTLSASQTFTWTVRPANQPPVLTNPGAQTSDVGVATALQLQASDAQGQTLTYSATGVPAGLTLAASTGRIAGTPTTAGDFTVTATVSDGALSASQTFTWAVQTANQPPVLTNPGAQTSDIGQATALQLQASDSQGQTLTYSSTGLPPGLSLTTSTGQIAGTPTTAGTFTVTVTVSDGLLSATQMFAWTVNSVNQPPALTNPGAQTGDVGQATALQLQANDAQGQTLTYSATGVPAGLTLTASTGQIASTPATAGTFTVTATVSDGSLSASQSFSWLIRANNGAPSLSNPGTLTNDAGQSVVLQLQGTDPDIDPLMYSATGLPVGLLITTNTGRIAGTLTTAGTYIVTATVSDGSLTATQSFTWTVRPVNQPPLLTNPGAQTGDVGQATALQLQASDPEAQTLTYGATGLPAGLTLTTSTGRMAGTPTTAGTFTVTATVSDGLLSASQSFTWTIRPANQPPVLTNPGAQTGDVGQATALQLQASDPEAQTLTYGATGLPAGLTLTASTGRIAGTPTTAGTFTVTATVSDGTLSASQTLTWTVRPANQPPVLTNPGAQTGDVGQATALQPQASDPEAQALTYSANGLPAGLTLTTSTGRMAGTPTTAGTFTVTATVSDGLLSASQSFTWTIRPANQPPVLTNPGAQTGDVGKATALQPQASDPEAQALTYVANGLPAGLTLTTSTGRIAGTPTTAGTFTVTATVSDGLLSASQSFTWTIRPANQPPVLTNPAAQTGDVGQATALQLQASDPEGQTLTYGATALPPGLSITASTGRIAGTPTTAGTFTVTASGSDGALSATEVFTWTIRESVTTTTPTSRGSGQSRAGSTAAPPNEPTTPAPPRVYTGTTAVRRSAPATETGDGGSTTTGAATGRRPGSPTPPSTPATTSTGRSTVLPENPASTSPATSTNAEAVAANAPAAATTEPVVDSNPAPITAVVPAPDAAPTVEIQTPVGKASFVAGTRNIILFSATADDAEEGDVSSRIVWSSDRDGTIGVGARVSKALRAGAHTITATISDRAGNTRTARVAIVVRTARPQR